MMNYMASDWHKLAYSVITIPTVSAVFPILVSVSEKLYFKVKTVPPNERSSHIYRSTP